MSVEIKDERSPKPEEAPKSVEVVRASIVELLSQRGIKVQDGSPNALQVTLQYPEQVPDGWHREYCITMMSRLKMSQGFFSESGGYGCFEYKHFLLGISLGGDSSKAYTTALNLMLEQHDKQMSRVFSRQQN
jgi:hypothetical protein